MGQWARRPMRIMIDFTQIPLARTGVGVYADHLVEHLFAFLQPEDKLFLVVQSDEPKAAEWVRMCERVRIIAIPSSLFRNRLMLLFFEQMALPLVAGRHRVDVLHSLHYTAPLFAGARRIVTIHDLTFLLFPELHTRARLLVMSRFLRAALRRADGLIYVSESTRRDADRLVPGRRGQAAVAPLGVENAQPVPEERVQSILLRLKVPRPFILNIGTIEPRKNVITLIRAFDGIAGRFPDLTLVVAGKLGWKYNETLEAMRNSPHAERIRSIGFISDEEKRALLQACDLFVYPSLYEGFGLPLLEGMAAGAPVVGSNISSMPEVVGEAGELVNPSDAAGLASTIADILSDPNRRARMREAGRRRAAMFTWEKTAEQTYAHYGAVCRSAPVGTERTRS